MKDILSPITHSPNVKVIKKISSKTIVELYQSDLEVDVQTFFNKIDYVFLCKCIDTGFLFYHPENLSGDESFYNRLKVQLPAKYNTQYYSDWKWEYDVCINYIKKTDKVYEIGCGNGNFLMKLAEKGIENISGSELNMDSVLSAKNKGLNVEYKTIQDKAKIILDSYDVVCTFQVLEHIYDVKSFLDSSLKILKKGGKLIIAVPFNNPYLFGHDILNTLNLPPHHMGLWNLKTFKSLQKHFPLKLEKLIIEKLPLEGYDFERYFLVNKDINYSVGLPFKKLYDKLYFKWLKAFHSYYSGKNIVAIYNLV
jgi:SAM-dependent methyltransferase